MGSVPLTPEERETIDSLIGRELHRLYEVGQRSWPEREACKRLHQAREALAALSSQRAGEGEATDAVLRLLSEAGCEPYMARVRDHPDVADLRRADKDAERRNREFAQSLVHAALSSQRAGEPTPDEVERDDRQWTVPWGKGRQRIVVVPIGASRERQVRHWFARAANATAEVERLREALQQIIDAHDEDRGIAYGDDLEAEVLSIARAALNAAGTPSPSPDEGPRRPLIQHHPHDVEWLARVREDHEESLREEQAIEDDLLSQQRFESNAERAGAHKGFKIGLAAARQPKGQRAGEPTPDVSDEGAER